MKPVPHNVNLHLHGLVCGHHPGGQRVNVNAPEAIVQIETDCQRPSVYISVSLSKHANTLATQGCLYVCTICNMKAPAAAYVVGT